MTWISSSNRVRRRRQQQHHNCHRRCKGSNNSTAATSTIAMMMDYGGCQQPLVVMLCVVMFAATCGVGVITCEPTPEAAAAAAASPLSVMGDECDWTGSGLNSAPASRGVTPIYLRCTGGRVRWLYPRGALRIILRLPASSVREFRACIRLRPDSDGVDDEYDSVAAKARRRRRETGDGTEQAAAPVPARLFLEGPRSLLPLYAANDGSATTRARCFNSKNGQAAIYVEALPGESFEKRVADIEYDLQALPRGSKGFDPTEECRPCTMDELAHAFCTSDLVTRGIIRGVENIDDLELSEMTVKVTKMIRNTNADDFVVFDGDVNRDNSVYAIAAADAPSISATVNRSTTTAEHVTVHVAQHCRVQHGLGEFVFMARRKLGDLRLQCAPRLEDWATLVHQLTAEGRAHCQLHS